MTCDEEIESKLHEGYNFLISGNYKNAFDIFSYLDTCKNSEAAGYLGYMYWQAYGVDKNIEKAISYFDRAIVAGSIPALFQKAKLLEEKNLIEEAIKIHKVAADNEYLPSIYALFRIGYYHPDLMTKEENDSYFKRAIDGGHIYATKFFVRKMIRGEMGILGIIKAIPLSVKAILEIRKIIAEDPNSDRLR